MIVAQTLLFGKKEFDEKKEPNRNFKKRQKVQKKPQNIYYIYCPTTFREPADNYMTTVVSKIVLIFHQIFLLFM